MSIFGFLGNAAKSVGKVALGAVKIGANVAGNVAGVGTIFPAGQPVATASSLPAGSQVYETTSDTVPVGQAKSLPAVIKDTLISFTDWISGKQRPQVDVNVGTQSQLPSWLLPVGIGAAALFMLSGRRR